MQRIRTIAVVVLVALMTGTISASAGYAWYLRSALHRKICAQELSTRLGLPSEIGAIQPLSMRAREFLGIRVYLPDRRDLAMHAARARVVSRPTLADPAAYDIEIDDGHCEISPRTWLTSDYRMMFDAGARSGFLEGGPQRVTLRNMDLSYARDGFRIRLLGVNGAIDFDEKFGHGHAFCQHLNDHFSSEPISLTATFSPRGNAVLLDHLELTVPRLPIDALQIGALWGAAVHHGSFYGRLTYREANGSRTMSVSGTCFDVDLAELTSGLLATPLRGRCGELEIMELRIVDQRPTLLRFRGILSGMQLSDLLAPLGLPCAGGLVTLRVREATLSPDGIDRLIASGECQDMLLSALSDGLGLGRMAGRAQLAIDDLTIERNRVRSLEAAAIVDGPEEGGLWVEGALLRSIVQNTMRITLPPVLPDRIEYVQLGARFDMRDEVLTVLGTHGPREKTIFTARLFGRDIALIPEPGQSFDLRAWFDSLRAQAIEHLARELPRVPLPAERWFPWLTIPPATQPHPNR